MANLCQYLHSYLKAILAKLAVDLFLTHVH